MHARFVLAATLLANLFAVPLTSQTPIFQVLVLDALNGQPQPNVAVRQFCEGQGSKGDSIKTGPDGKAVIPYMCENGARIYIWVIAPGNKEECGTVDDLKIGDILSSGFISEPTGAGNIWCPNKQRRKLNPVPGQVTIFVKKPTWYQAHIAG